MIYHSKNLVLVIKGRAFYETLYQGCSFEIQGRVGPQGTYIILSLQIISPLSRAFLEYRISDPKMYVLSWNFVTQLFLLFSFTLKRTSGKQFFFLIPY